MAISYNAGTNTITLDGVNTYTLLDIYNADVAGGWGVVTQAGEMYLFMCDMVVGDAGGNATKLIDSNVGLQIGVTGTRKTFQTLAGSSFEMTGCILKFWISAQTDCWGNWEIENCSIFQRGSLIAMVGNQDYKRTEIDGASWYNSVGICSYERCLFKGTLFRYNTPSGTINDLTVNAPISNAYHSAILKNSNIIGQLRIQTTAGIFVTLINCTFNTLAFQFDNNYMLDKWEFNVMVTDKDNNPLVAGIELKDKNGVVKHSAATGADGKLASTWEVIANRYDGTSETKTEYNPFTLTVTKAGYADYETEITIDHIIDSDQIVLDGLTYTYDEIMDEIKKVKGICLFC